MNCFFREQKEALHNCTKPYQYVGGEFLSYNKDFNSADVRVLLAFPDKYEIGKVEKISRTAQTAF